MKDTLTIAFNGGAYGTYLEWAINSLMSTNPIKDPFDIGIGNSHNSKLGYHLWNITKFKKYIANPDLQYLTCRLHPKITQSEKIADSLAYILENTTRLILLYPDRSHELMCICNYMNKIWKTHHYFGAMTYVNFDDIFNNYPIDPSTDLEDIPLWIQREHMSFNLFSSWHDQVEWYFPDQWSHPNAMIITTKDLFDNFTNVLNGIEKFWGKHYVRNAEELIPYHKKMISLQKNYGKDQLCDQIIKSVLGQAESMSWDEIGLVSQAWIQYHLRCQGYEIRCHGLDVFPSNTIDLKSMIYKN